ncbi:MAG TPA: hypothetical protein VMV92_39430 [Streptosporangiaceae bacterium]|nr:hypothetical protein [Streptosporangiaceae bacterium]
MITYVVTGTPGTSVTYGPAGSNFKGQIPMRITKRLRNTVFYAITAQLRGSGSVTCEILIGMKVISKAVATGGHHIASCEITQDPPGGAWHDANSG